MNWKRIHMVVEGSSEETFVNKVLTPHFSDLSIDIKCQRITTNSAKQSKGGFVSFARLKSSLEAWYHADKKNPDILYTCMVDYYGFPRGSQSPLTEDILKIGDPYKQIESLEAGIGSRVAVSNFIPYVQLYEFETLLLVQPEVLLELYPEAKKAIEKLKSSLEESNVELVNGSEARSPSKRIIACLPEYEGSKAILGPLVAEEIGLQKLRHHCRNFNDWISKLEGSAPKNQ